MEGSALTEKMNPWLPLLVAFAEIFLEEDIGRMHDAQYTSSKTVCNRCANRREIQSRPHKK